MSVNANFLSQARQLYEQFTQIDQGITKAVSDENLVDETVSKYASESGLAFTELIQLSQSVNKAFYNNVILTPVEDAQNSYAIVEDENKEIVKLLLSTTMLSNHINCHLSSLLHRSIQQLDPFNGIDSNVFMFDAKANGYVLLPSLNFSIQKDNIFHAQEFLKKIQEYADKLSQKEFRAAFISDLEKLDTSFKKTHSNLLKKLPGFPTFSDHINNCLLRILNDKLLEKKPASKVIGSISLLLNKTSITECIRAAQDAIVCSAAFPMCYPPHLVYSDGDKEAINQSIELGLNVLEQLEMSEEDLNEGVVNLAHFFYEELYRKYQELQSANPDMISPDDPCFEGRFGRLGWMDDRVPFDLKQEILRNQLFHTENP